MDVRFPVFVLAKDCGKVMRFGSVHEMQGYMEEIDVENYEYAAWDCDGVRLELKVQEPVWIRITADREDSESLRKALVVFAKSEGVDTAGLESKPADFVTAFDEIHRRVESRLKQRKWWHLFSLRG